MRTKYTKQSLDDRKVLADIIATISDTSISRKDFIRLAADNGLAETVTATVLSPANRSNERGKYDVALMSSTIARHIAKKTISTITTIMPSKRTREAESLSGTYRYDALAPTQRDINEELSLMGTHL